jgi:hypothetical protein
MCHNKPDGFPVAHTHVGSLGHGTVIGESSQSE